MRETIYRDDAVRVASGYCHPSNIAKELERLPSAQPERLNVHESQKDADCISRQAAIDALDRFSLGETDAIKLAFRMGDYLKRLPSAQPERKTGHWVGIDDEPSEVFECDVCGHIIECGDLPNFCENCGSDMREVEHETQ